MFVDNLHRVRFDAVASSGKWDSETVQILAAEVDGLHDMIYIYDMNEY